MSAVLERIRRTARLRPQRLVLVEVEDDRVVRAADRLARDGLAEVTLLGAREAARSTARRLGVGLTGVRLDDAGDAAEIARTAEALTTARGGSAPR